MVQTSHVVWSTPHPMGHSVYVVPTDASAEIKSWAGILSDAGFPVFVCTGTNGHDGTVAAALALANTNKSLRCLPGTYTFASPLQIPVVQNYFFDARGCTFLGGVHMDSFMDSVFWFHVIARSTGAILEIEPSADSEILGTPTVYSSTVSKIYWTSLGQSNTVVPVVGTIGLKLNAGSGKNIDSNIFEGNLIENCETSISVPSANTGLVYYNQIKVNTIQNTETVYADNQYTRYNMIDINYLSLRSTATGVGINTDGLSNFFRCTLFNNCTASSSVIWGTNANYNIMDAGQTVWAAGITDNSVSKVNKIVGGGNFHSGSSTILNGTTSAVITHGITYTPTIRDISVTLGENPTNTPGAIWVDTITGSSFTVNCENDPGASNLDFGWVVRKG